MAEPLTIPSATAVRTIDVNGGNLFRIALDELGDALQWNRIASANRLLDPFLPENTLIRLIIPPINTAADRSGLLKPNFGAPVFSLSPVSGAIFTHEEQAPEIPIIPVNVIIPIISGIPTVGQTLTASDGTWTNTPTSFTFKWKFGTIVVGVDQTYTIEIGDEGKSLTVTVIALNDAGPSLPATSAPTSAIDSILTYDFSDSGQSGIQAWLKAW